ncbi:putative nucleotidyltransferase [Virgibacillus halotolerans]|uniref:type VII toxin-antitoxin system MntA family adenylyltransferase antitoxin n=1 Tax=Virgibacillus halotolerans TaxID=1071053 RepID=UPI0019609C24|nr:putative nucleotidyltransferase [Virgibacillus halotolerans]
MSTDLERSYISHRFLGELIRYCSKNDYIEKVMLFGSRARGDFRPNSDIDLAIYTNQATHSKQNLIEADIQEMPTYLKIDIVFLDRLNKKELLANIRKEGVVIYEQTKAQRKA